MKNFLPRAASLVIVCTLLTNNKAWSDSLDEIPFKSPVFLPKLEDEAPPALPEKEMSLNDFFPKSDLPYLIAYPVDLDGLKITGLQPKLIHTLGNNLFVVVENTPYSTMADVYRDNRLKGKSNFVTADCIVNAYFALHNAILAAVIKERLCPGLASMLSAMLKVAARDYRNTEDAEVKEEIQKNIAYISVALRLLEPGLTLPNLGGATKLADTELQNINSGHICQSVIFGGKEDFALYKPLGWYNNEPALRNFYRCRQWLSRMSLPLTDLDVEKSDSEHSTNKFRQSVLLFRTLDKATIGGEPAMNTWQNFYRVWLLLGAEENKKEHPLLPADYKKVFRSSAQTPSNNSSNELADDLPNELKGLSEPFFRTKLLLNIRRNQPLELGTTSILKMSGTKQGQMGAAVFRFLPLVDEPELPWLCQLAHQFTEPRAISETTPFSLLELFGRGSVLATNVLGETNWRLDPTLFDSLPALLEATGRKRATANSKDAEGSWTGNWNVLSHYFESMIESAQTPLKTDLWMRRRLESAFAAWVDSHVACLNDTDERKTAEISHGGQAADVVSKIPVTAESDRSADSANMTRPAIAHYLEPAPALYKSIRIRLQQTVDELKTLGYFPSRYTKDVETLSALCQRFESIAQKEISNLYVSPADTRFLGAIDQELDKLSPPLAGTLYLDSDTQVDKSGHQVGGANLCLGHPGQIFILLRTFRGSTLCRGAVYTYYELRGGPITAEAWQHKLNLALVHSPKWTAEFDLIQSPQEKAVEAITRTK